MYQAVSPLRSTLAIAAIACAAFSPAGAETTKSFRDGKIQISFHHSGEESHGMKSSKDWSDAEIQAVERAFAKWDRVIANDPGRVIRIAFYFNNFTKVATSRAVYLKVAPAESKLGFDRVTTIERVWRDGKEAADSGADFQVVVNPERPLYTGEGKPGPREMDLESMIAHEFGHALGFMSGAKPDGQFQGMTAFDRLMKVDGKPIAAPYAFGTSPTLGETGLTVYNPPQWRGGSSMSHVVNKEGKPSLMKFSLTWGEVNRELTRPEVEVMALMGWKTR